MSLNGMFHMTSSAMKNEGKTNRTRTEMEKSDLYYGIEKHKLRDTAKALQIRILKGNYSCSNLAVLFKF